MLFSSLIKIFSIVNSSFDMFKIFKYIFEEFTLLIEYEPKAIFFQDRRFVKYK